MLTLIAAAAVAAAQPATPAPTAHGDMPAAHKEGCCCKDMEKEHGDAMHDRHSGKSGELELTT